MLVTANLLIWSNNLVNVWCIEDKLGRKMFYLAVHVTFSTITLVFWTYKANDEELKKNKELTSNL